MLIYKEKKIIMHDIPDVHYDSDITDFPPSLVHDSGAQGKFTLSMKQLKSFTLSPKLQLAAATPPAASNL